MSMPGFTADASLYTTTMPYYQAARWGGGREVGVQSSALWGPSCQDCLDACSAGGSTFLRFCGALRNPVQRAGCFALQFAGVVACNGWCYWHFCDDGGASYPFSQRRLICSYLGYLCWAGRQEACEAWRHKCSELACPADHTPCGGRCCPPGTHCCRNVCCSDDWPTFCCIAGGQGYCCHEGWYCCSTGCQAIPCSRG